LIPIVILAVILLSLVLGSFFTVNTAQVAVITRFGKFLRVAEAGLNWKLHTLIRSPAWSVFGSTRSL
jgi:regulator of protease activity HflC (stomatin/prohibitin superfamily)